MNEIEQARDPDTSTEVLEDLSRHSNYRIRMEVAKHFKVSIKIIEKLSIDTIAEVRIGVAQNSFCPVWILEKLSNDFHHSVRYWVAKHPNCPTGVLESFLKDSVLMVRETAEKNLKKKNPARLTIDWSLEEKTRSAEDSDTSVEILDALSKDSDYCVRYRVARHPNCPIKVLNVLSRDSDYNVRYWVARHHNCPAEALEKLSKDSNGEVRYGAAQHPNCPAEILKELSKDSYWNVRYLVAHNPNCPMEVLEKLSKDSDYSVRCEVARHPNCPVEVLDVLSKDSDYCVRYWVAHHPNCPAEVLNVLSMDSDSNVRYEAASHPNCPDDDVLEALIDDSSEEVRIFASKRLEMKKEKTRTISINLTESENDHLNDLVKHFEERSIGKVRPEDVIRATIRGLSIDDQNDALGNQDKSEILEQIKENNMTQNSSPKNRLTNDILPSVGYKTVRRQTERFISKQAMSVFGKDVPDEDKGAVARFLASAAGVNLVLGATGGILPHVPMGVGEKIQENKHAMGICNEMASEGISYFTDEMVEVGKGVIGMVTQMTGVFSSVGEQIVEKANSIGKPEPKARVSIPETAVNDTASTDDDSDEEEVKPSKKVKAVSNS